VPEQKQWGQPLPLTAGGEFTARYVMKPPRANTKAEIQKFPRDFGPLMAITTLHTPLR
jgi:hypothetical protein